MSEFEDVIKKIAATSNGNIKKNMSWITSKSFKKGDKAIIIDCTSAHCFTVGDKVRLIKKHSTIKYAWYCKKWIFGVRQILIENEIKPIDCKIIKL